jgi:hypothetical protein
MTNSMKVVDFVIHLTASVVELAQNTVARAGGRLSEV